MSRVRVALAVLIVIAIGRQLLSTMQLPTFAPANFFSYFTNLSNLFTAGVLLAVARSGGRPSHAIDVARGAATLCMAMVGIIFSVLLAGLESDLIPWVNFVVHYLMPVVTVLDWLFDPPRTRLGIRDALLWLAIPLAYVAYTLVRGSLVHWYPYPFMNVELHGASVVAMYLGIMFAGSVILAAGIVALGNNGATRRRPSSTP